MAVQVSSNTITRAQLDRIKQSVNMDAVDFSQTEKLRLKTLSDDRASKWPNTLEAQRARKERARQERAAAEEVERLEVDRQESELNAEQRRLQIERANKILFDETDRVKGFHSTMQRSDVIQENELLMGYKKQISVLRKAQESAFVEQQRQALELAETAELRKFAEERARAVAQKDVQLRQLDDMRTRIIGERMENKREGQLLKKQALEEEEEMRQKDASRRAKSKQHTSDVTAANITLQAFKLKDIERAREAEMAMEVYAKKKAEMIYERERREIEKRSKKDAERQRVADMIERNHNVWMAKEKARLDRDVAASDARSAADDSARRQRIRDQAVATNVFNSAQLRAKADNKSRTKAEEAAYAEEWSYRLKELRQEEAEEAQSTVQRNKHFQSFQLRQAEIKSRKKAAAKIEEMQDAAQIQLTVREQEDVFRQYANEWVEEYRRQGKTTVPMELILNRKEKVETMK